MSTITARDTSPLFTAWYPQVFLNEWQAIFPIIPSSTTAAKIEKNVLPDVSVREQEEKAVKKESEGKAVPEIMELPDAGTLQEGKSTEAEMENGAVTEKNETES